MKLYDKVFPPKTITLANGKQIKKPRSRMPLVVLVLLAMTVISVRVTGFNMTVLVTRIREDSTGVELYAADLAAAL